MRFEVARKIVSRAADHGIPREDVVVDPLVMPIGAMGTAGRQVFRLVRRLREELGVNTTCGASNVSFGLPNRPALNAAFLPMAIASGMTSAITSPLHEEMRQAIWAADVMMGNDEHCAAWIARNGDAPEGPQSGRRGGRDEARRRRVTSAPVSGDAPDAAGRRTEDRADHLVVFTPSGRRGRFADGTTVLEAARRLGVDIDSVCGGRGICGRCQVEVSEGEHAKHGIVSTATHLSPVGDVERAYAAQRPLARRAPPRLHGRAQRRPRHRRAAGEPGAPPGRAQGGRRPPDRGRPGRPPALRRGGAARPGRRRRATSAASARRSSASGQLTGLAFDPHVVTALQRTLRTSDTVSQGPGAWSVTVAVHDGVGRDGDLARLPRRGLRHRVRRRLDDGRRAPVRPAHGRGARLGRAR